MLTYHLFYTFQYFHHTLRQPLDLFLSLPQLSGDSSGHHTSAYHTGRVLPWASSLPPQSCLCFELSKSNSALSKLHFPDLLSCCSLSFSLLKVCLHLKTWGIKIKLPKSLLRTEQSLIILLSSLTYGSPGGVSLSFPLFAFCATNGAASITYHSGTRHLLTNPKLQEYMGWLLIPLLRGWENIYYSPCSEDLPYEKSEDFQGYRKAMVMLPAYKSDL